MRQALNVLCAPADYVVSFEQLIIFPLFIGIMSLALVGILVQYVFAFLFGQVVGSIAGYGIFLGVLAWFVVGIIIGMPLRWYLYNRHNPSDWRYY